MSESNSDFLGGISTNGLDIPVGRSSINKYPPSVVFSKQNNRVRKVPSKENQISFDSRARLREALLQVFESFNTQYFNI